MTDNQAAAVEYAARTLGIRPLSRSQLLKKMQEKGYSRPDSQFALDKMIEIGAQDDLQYAQILAQDRFTRGYGPNRIKQDLIVRGISRDIVEEILDDLPPGRDAITEYIEARTHGETPDRREAKKIYDALVRRGFHYGDISECMQEFLEDN